VGIAHRLPVGKHVYFNYGVIMVSAADRRHFGRIAAIEAQLNDQSVRQAAEQTPGENIALGFELAEFAVAFGGDVSHAEEIPPIRLWRARVTGGPGRP
jgi:hypothetical protein